MTAEDYDAKVVRMAKEIERLTVELDKLRSLPVIQNCHSCGHMTYWVCDRGACPVVPQSVADVVKSG
jgi:hypothetical protein